jgi:uncharacterized protein YodC (DUF2158 family)
MGAQDMPNPESFKNGDVVQLKSGGPKMTIESRSESQDRFRCVWFDNDGKEHGKEFDQIRLVKVG